MKKILAVVVLICSLAVGGESSVTVTPVQRADGRAAYRLSDGTTEAVVVPALARVLQYEKVGGTNWLWNAPPDKVDLNGWKNYGGEKAWVSPQSTWPLFIGHPFPPDDAWEGGHQAEVLENPPRLRTTSQVSKCGVRLIREFSFEGGEFVTTTTLEKMDDTPLIAGAWTITQIPPPDAVFLPTSEASAYKNGFYNFSRKPIGNITGVTPSLVRVIPTVAGAYKIGVDAPVVAIVAVRNGEALVEHSTHANGRYPDGAEDSGFPVELFDLGQNDRHYIELELLSPIAPLLKGQHRTFIVRWSLHTLPSPDIDSAETRQAIEKLLGQLK